MKENSKSKQYFTNKQLAWFILSILLLGAGILLLIFGLIGDYAKSLGNVFSAANAQLTEAFHFGLTLTWLGVFFLLLGGVIFAVALSFSGKNDDREKEREARRNQRLKAMQEDQQVVVVDASNTQASVNEDNKKQ